MSPTRVRDSIEGALAKGTHPLGLLTEEIQDDDTRRQWQALEFLESLTKDQLNLIHPKVFLFRRVILKELVRIFRRDSSWFMELARRIGNIVEGRIRAEIPVAHDDALIADALGFYDDASIDAKDPVACCDLLMRAVDMSPFDTLHTRRLDRIVRRGLIDRPLVDHMTRRLGLGSDAGNDCSDGCDGCKTDIETERFEPSARRHALAFRFNYRGLDRLRFDMLELLENRQEMKDLGITDAQRIARTLSFLEPEGLPASRHGELEMINLLQDPETGLELLCQKIGRSSMKHRSPWRPSQYRSRELGE